MGPSRSGSSMFENFLFKQNIATACGELRWIFERGKIKNEICSCGAKFNDCSFWTKIHLKKEDAKLGAYFRRKFDNPINIFFGKYLGKNFKVRRDYLHYTSLIRKVYLQSLNISSNIIDNSKSPFYLIVLRDALKNNKIALKVIHFNRDLGGIINSYQKKKIRWESADHELMKRKNFLEVIFYWIAINLISKLVPVESSSKRYIRYDNFCKNPTAVLNLPIFLNEQTDMQVLNHSISGNPDRFEGFKEIKQKITKKKKINPLARLIIIISNYFFY